ncbi:MAG: EAL domain-containing protein [Proteobacteria bacterium]|nr:EAL domain-containing protein [Pseudomonadota bacterium]
MKITYKLISGFTVVILLTLLLGYLSIHISQNALKQVLGDRSVLVTEQLLHKIEMRVHNNIEIFEEYITNPALIAELKRSNAEFAALSDPAINAMIDSRDAAWTASSSSPASVASSILSNSTSSTIRDKMLFYDRRSTGNKVFGEVFITNRYGANIAMSNKTTDYRQNDEAWWQEAAKGGSSIVRVSHDESANIEAFDVGLRIDGPDGEFLGVLNMALNIEDAIGVIKAFEQKDGNHQADMKLLTGEGSVIYSTDVDTHFVSHDEGSLFSRMTEKSGFLTVVHTTEDGHESEEELFAYSRSVGFGGFAGLGWIMVVEHDSDDAFAAVAGLKQWLVIIISTVVLLAALMSWFVSRAISRPLEKFKAATAGIGEGDFTTRIEVDSADEMRDVAMNFNNMAERLETTMKERDDEIVVRKKGEEAVTQMAYYDQLTGLPNRNLFMDRLDQMIKRDLWRKRLAALFYMDLDRFKMVNDSLGHHEGDKLLVAVAERLQASLRDGDVVARLGGDEFGMLLQDLARVEDLPMVVEKVFDSFRTPLVLSGEEVSVSGCIGISIFPHDGDTAATLLKNAEIAMYRAKGEGKNMYQLFTKSMASKSMEALRIESVLDNAVERDLLVLHYQPQLSLSTGKITGTEALVRLKDPEGGLIPPLKFIDIAEETGLIVQIGNWVLNTACAQGKEWHDAGYDELNVSVNISARQFNDSNFVETVAHALKVSGFEPEHLDLEITESVVMTDAKEVVKKMHKLKGLGVKFSVDDFGTGYSSLSYMKLMPIDMLKIDRSFVQDIMTDRDDRSIITAIITMAHSLGLDVIAEGVEERNQLDLLVSLGCDKLQGYYFSKPVEAKEHTEKLATGACLDLNKKAG